MRTRIVLAVGALALTAGVTGCGATALEPDQEFEPTGRVYGIPDEYGSIYDTELNGVRCMVYVGDRQGGISCDWNDDDSEGATP